MNRIWIDVEDLFHYAASMPRPSGIQRLSFEIQQALVEQFGTGGAIRFLRHDLLHGGFREIAWDEVVALFRYMVTAGPAPAAPRQVIEPPRRGWLRRKLRPSIQRLPTTVREPLTRAVRHQLECLQALAGAARLQVASWCFLLRAAHAALRPHHKSPSPHDSASPPGPTEKFGATVQAGDTLLVLGSPWWRDDYGELVRLARARHGMRFALLVYDLIPIRRPEWCDRYLVIAFTGWLDEMLPLADAVLTISRATARDVAWHAERHGIALAGPITPITIGHGFGVAPAAASPSPSLPEAGSYVLFVSTIEARKNHMLLFRVWRRLLEEMPPGQVPTLVFAGRIGWLVADLMQQLDNAGHLGGAIVIIENPSDDDLAALYRGCLFTVFPSLYEGWGLPVTESLLFGKPCVVAAATSLPEAGGSFARYFDPDNLHDAVRVIRATLEDRAGLAAWQARIRREFRPIPWSASAQSVLEALAAFHAPVAPEP